MKTVKLYKWSNLQAVQAWDVKHGFSFDSCGRYGFVDCDNGAEYQLPIGYNVSETVAGEVGIFDDNSQHCEISHNNGLPVLYSSARGHVELPSVK